MPDNPWDQFTKGSGSRGAPPTRGAPRWVIEKHAGDRPDTGHGEEAPPDAIAEKFQCLHCGGDIYYSKLIGVHLHWRNARRFCKGTRGKQAVPDNVIPLFPDPTTAKPDLWSMPESPDDQPPF